VRRPETGLRFFCTLVAAAMASLHPGASTAQSQASSERFDGLKVLKGVSIDRQQCAQLERGHTAVWVEADGDAHCLRYYAFGLDPHRPNPRVVGWMHGDLVGGPDTTRARHQDGLGVAQMVDQMRRLSERHHAPFVFIARPGAYGSSGRHEPMTSTRREAALVRAQMDAIGKRYRIGEWILAGHSGGGTMAAEMLNRGVSIGCLVVSSGAPAHDAFMRAAWARFLSARQPTGQDRKLAEAKFSAARAHFDLNPVAAVDRISPRPGLRAFILADPRDRTVPVEAQRAYYDALRRRRVDVTFLELEKAAPPKRHSLVDHAEVAAGMCSQGAPTQEIVSTLRRMPEQTDRISN
jgi:pimeloyl-ACP methyl ester carboxylesterase